jgi:predicted porin
LGWRPDEAWNFGVSSSVGTYLIPGASGTEQAGNGFDDYRQITVAQDASFAWHHWQFWAECFETRFEIPLVGDADTVAYYIEAKYKFTPAFSAAVRWNQQFFNSIPDGAGGHAAWGSDLGRVDVAMTYRFTPHTQAKLQYSFLNQDDPSREEQSLVAAQFTVKF